MTCTVLGLCMIALNIPQTFSRFASNSIASCGVKENMAHYIFDIWPHIDSTFYVYLPTFLIFTLNGCIVFKMNKTNNSKDQLHVSAMSKNSKGITIMILAVSFAFVVFTLPSMIFTTYIETTKQHKYYFESLSYAILQVVTFLNHSSNFLCYVLTSPPFRTELKNIFCKNSLGHVSRPNAACI